MLSALGYGRGDDPDRNIHFAGQSTTLGCIPVHADAILPLLGRLQSAFLSRILRRHRLLLNGMAEGPPRDFQDTVRLDQVKRVMKNNLAERCLSLSKDSIIVCTLIRSSGAMRKGHCCGRRRGKFVADAISA